MTTSLIPVNSVDDVLPEWKGSPIERLLEFHNLGISSAPFDQPQMLIGTCMDFRVSIQIPDRFAFVLRTGGANFSANEFHIAYAISVGGVRAFAIIGHDDCGMHRLSNERTLFINGACEAGSDNVQAGDYYDQNVDACTIPDPAEFTFNEATRYAKLFPDVTVAPLLYTVGDGKLSQVCR